MAREVTPATPSYGGYTGLEIWRTDSGQRIQAFNPMVDTPSDRRDGPEILHSAAVNDYRCFQFRVGSDSERQVSQRQMVCGRDLHINHLELLAVFRGVKSFRRHLRNRRVTVHLDNITATAHLSKEGRTRLPHLNKLTMDILLFRRNHGVVLTPAYLPGIANLGADALSRGKETSEWFINPIVTRQMFRRFGHPQIDLFASNRPAQAETYASSHPLLVQGSLATRTPADVSSDASTPTSASGYGERPDHRQEPAVIPEAQADSMAYLRNTFQNQGADHTLAEFICGSQKQHAAATHYGASSQTSIKTDGTIMVDEGAGFSRYTGSGRFNWSRFCHLGRSQSSTYFDHHQDNVSVLHTPSSTGAPFSEHVSSAGSARKCLAPTRKKNFLSEDKH